ncbi:MULTISPECIES: DUF799 domain-containing protein [Ralstonia]|jgi:hypothetical protein|uniref:Lipoprotein/NMB1162 n=1 Tax=Ralstonia flaminis TaxID=3058597 RepID=A0ABN9JRF5_9RALS|nr:MULTISPECIES: DUF799 domain-containing protein [unclassified Ralstonia]CAJ0818315.1 Putative lipoprotein/NMB1162 [Ralstonia sp. LMG 18101]
MAKRFLKLFAAASVVALMAGCAAPTKNIDYSAFKASKPRSIVVLPPLNESPDVGATYGMLSQVTVPLAEAGYYVLPVALVDETFRQNGLTTAGDIHGVPVAKLHDIFGADAALYVTVTQYGSKYMVVSSATVVSADAKLVDLKSGQTLWTGHASASNNEGGNNSGGGLIGMLVSAAVNQIIANVTDQGYKVAGTTSARLLSAGQPGGLLYGPRSPKYGTD